MVLCPSLSLVDVLTQIIARTVGGFRAATRPNQVFRSQTDPIATTYPNSVPHLTGSRNPPNTFLNPPNHPADRFT